MEFERIAFLKLCCAGDILFATPAIRAVRQAYPNSQISFITGPYSKFIPEHNPHIDNVIIVPPPFETINTMRAPFNLLRDIRAIRKGKFDLVISLHRSRNVGLMAKLAGAKLILSFKNARPFTDMAIAFDPERLELLRYLDLVAAIGAQTDGSAVEYSTTPEEDDKASEILRTNGITGPFAVIAPGGGVNPGTTMFIKRWPVLRFREISSHLKSDNHLKVVAVGASSEIELCSNIDADVNLAGQTTFPLLAAVLRKAELVIGNDSAPLYLASSVGARTIGIYGPTSPRHFGVIGPNDSALVSPVYCHPCHHPAKIKRGFITCPTGTWACMLTLKVEDVAREIDRLRGPKNV